MSIMKIKHIIIILVTAVIVTGSIFTVRSIRVHRAYPMLDANTEALLDEEIIVGPLCATCPDRACSSLGEVYEEHVKI